MAYNSSRYWQGKDSKGAMWREQFVKNINGKFTDCLISYTQKQELVEKRKKASMEFYSNPETQKKKEKISKRLYLLVQNGIQKIKAEHLPAEEEKKRIEEMIDAMCVYLEKFSEKGTVNFLATARDAYASINKLTLKDSISRKDLLKAWLREYEDSLKANDEKNRQEGRENGSYDENELDLL